MILIENITALSLVIYCAYIGYMGVAVITTNRERHLLSNTRKTMNFDLKAFRKENKLSQSELCFIWGIAQPYVSALENGTRPVNKEKIKVLIDNYGEEKVSKHLSKDIIIKESKGAKEEIGAMVPMIPLTAHGGSINDAIKQVSKISTEFIISPIPEAEIAIVVSGESMAPEFPAGARVLIREIDQTAFIEWGETFVLDTVNGVVLRQLMPGSDGDKLLCKAINVKFPPFEVLKNDVRSIYRVLLVMSTK